MSNMLSIYSQSTQVALTLLIAFTASLLPWGLWISMLGVEILSYELLA